MNNKLKVLTVIGTRPEIIRLSCVIKRLDENVDHILVHTGQNYDYELNEIFFKDLGLRKPDYFLNVDTKSLGSVIGDIFKNIEPILKKEKPDAFLVLGDTNSCLSAYIAKRIRIPIFHMEAGNRCFDLNVPEEINRRVIDHLADFNLVYTEHARRHLIAEGLPQRRIYLTGSPMNEVINYNKTKIESSDILQRLKLKEKNYFLASIHREENVDNAENLKEIFNAIDSISKIYKKEIIVSTHPRTRKRLKENKINFGKNIKFLAPFAFTEYINLQMNAICTLSDSGTISEESAILNFPAVTIRNAMERPEALDCGSIILTGLNENAIIESINAQVNQTNNGIKKIIPADYNILNTSYRVLNLILGLSKLSNKWNGIQECMI